VTTFQSVHITWTEIGVRVYLYIRNESQS